MTERPPIIVTHNVADSRFEVRVQDQIAECVYQSNGPVVALVHTGVPHALEGKGIAAALVKAALAWARAESLVVQPRCSDVATYMQRHPETQDLLAKPI